MRLSWSSTGRFVFALYLVALHASLGYLSYRVYFDDVAAIRPVAVDSVGAPLADTPVPTPLDAPEEFADAAPQPSLPATQPALPPQNGELDLAMPVSGVRPEQLTDTFADSRSDGRVHEALDIMAPAGTPVVAAADGTIVKFWDSERGGITIYQRSPSGSYIYYYAHLQRRADAIREGQAVTRGTLLGYVGDTGNAGAGNFHLHFAVYRVTDPRRYWEGEPIDPYPLLRGRSTPD
ncbi:MAG: M23 family metallopeptidase [Pyrinomonadaceae bacterium]